MKPTAALRPTTRGQGKCRSTAATSYEKRIKLRHDSRHPAAILRIHAAILACQVCCGARQSPAEPGGYINRLCESIERHISTPVHSCVAHRSRFLFQDLAEPLSDYAIFARLQGHGADQDSSLVEPHLDGRFALAEGVRNVRGLHGA